MSKKLYYEEVTHRIGGHVIISNISEATAEQIAAAAALHAAGRCPHTIVEDEYGWDYDYRWCATCGKGLGSV